MLKKDKVIRLLAILSLVALVDTSIMGAHLLFVDLKNISDRHIQNLQKVHDTAQGIIDNLTLNLSLANITIEDKDTEIKKLKEQVSDLNTANTVNLTKAQQIIDMQAVQLQGMSDAGNRLVDFMNTSMMLSSECLVVKKEKCMNAEETGNADACGF